MSQKSKVILLVKALSELALTTDNQKRAGLTEKIRTLNDELTLHYEIRYRANGYSVTASANTLAKAKKRFIHKLFCMSCTKGASNND